MVHLTLCLCTARRQPTGLAAHRMVRGCFFRCGAHAEMLEDCMAMSHMLYNKDRVDSMVRGSFFRCGVHAEMLKDCMAMSLMHAQQCS